jgi:hypothetical protein
MAGYRYKQLVAMEWTNLQADQEEQRFHGEEDEDDAIPVSAVGKQIWAKATVIENDNDVLRFTSELKIKVYPGQEKILRLENHPPDLPSPSWRSVDVLTRERTANRKYAAVATYPYSLDWVDNAQFKPPGAHHNSKIELDVQKRAAIEYPTGHLNYVKNVLSYDLFETRNGYLTASMPSPERSLPGVATGRRYDNWTGVRAPKAKESYIRSTRADRNLEESWVFGICSDVAECCDILRKDERAASLFSQTMDGTIFEKRNLGHSVLRMHEVSEKAKTLATEVMEASIAKALAGPVYDAEEWTKRRRPVFDLVEDIYCYTLYDLNRRSRYGDGMQRVLPNSIPKPKQVPFHYAYWLGFLEHELAQLPSEIDDETLLTTLKRNLGDSDKMIRFRACIYAAALRRIVDKEMLPQAQLFEIQESDSSSEVRTAARLTLKEIESW